MKRNILLILILTFALNRLFATHNRAGEITYRQISGLLFEVTITTYTYTLGLADRNSLYISWGDNAYEELFRINGPVDIDGNHEGEQIGDDYKSNIYRGTHTYPGPGVYRLFVEDPNRNEGVKNIPNSVNVFFAIESALVINANIGANSTPVLTNRPIGKAYVDQVFIHNPGAYDSDGDSISYSLTVCRGENGAPIEGYEFPADSTELYINPLTGDLVWDSPKEIGKYNVALNIKEWRNGIRIGNVIRDMQIDVLEAENNPPVNSDLKDYCVLADSLIEFDIVGTDVDNNTLKQTAVGGPFLLGSGSATFIEAENSPGYVRSTFSWTPLCAHVRDAEYLVVVQTEDNVPSGGATIKSYDSDNFNIKVLAPPPIDLQAIPYTDSIGLYWEPCGCENIDHYEIYRRTGDFFYLEDSCSNGIPENLEFVLVGKTEDNITYSLSDIRSPDNIQQGIEYCYLAVGVFKNGTQTKVSNKACASLIQGEPAIVKVSVEVSDNNNGEIDLSWLKPSQNVLDTINMGPPFYYRILRRNPELETFVVIDSVVGNIDDTVYVDNNINTLVYPYYYRIEFVYTDLFSSLRKTFLGGIASSSYPQLVPSDNQVTVSLLKDAPWRNVADTVFYYTGTNSFEELTVMGENESYVHKGLTNNQEYYYQVRSKGIYSKDSVEYLTYNKSHVLSVTPADNIPPCAPVVEVDTNCSIAQNVISWRFDLPDCINDVYSYNVYYSYLENAPLNLLIGNLPYYDFNEYVHSPTISLAGCYEVTAVDSAGNESPRSVTVCVDGCEYFLLPNVFSPNGDNKNDLYTSIRLNDFVKRVDMSIYNRWGRLVYSTNDPDIRWDGRVKDSNEIAPSGVYYYVCDIYEPRLSGDQMRTLTGFIHVFSSNNSNPASGAE